MYVNKMVFTEITGGTRARTKWDAYLTIHRL